MARILSAKEAGARREISILNIRVEMSLAGMAAAERWRFHVGCGEVMGLNLSDLKFLARRSANRTNGRAALYMGGPLGDCSAITIHP